MAEGTKQTAKQRASFARADRLKKEEAAQNLDPPSASSSRKAARLIPSPPTTPALRPPNISRARSFPTFKDARVYLTPRGPVIARPSGRRAMAGPRPRAADGEKSRGAAWGGTEAATPNERPKRQSVQPAARPRIKALEKRKAEQKREADQKHAEQKKQDAAKLDAQRQEQQKQEAQKRADERRAEAHVAAQFKQQQADQIAEHRRQTSRLRTQHREQSTSLKCREGEAVDRHRHDIKTIDDREQQALKEFDVKRRSLTGRAAELVKGKAHFDGRREEMQKKFESDRLHKHRDLEALKERQFTAPCRSSA